MPTIVLRIDHAPLTIIEPTPTKPHAVLFNYVPSLPDDQLIEIRFLKVSIRQHEHKLCDNKFLLTRYKASVIKQSLDFDFENARLGRTQRHHRVPGSSVTSIATSPKHDRQFRKVAPNTFEDVEEKLQAV